MFYLLNSRYLRASSLRRALWVTNPVIWMAVGLLVLLQLVFVYAPFMNTWFHSAPLAPLDWLLPIAIGFGIFLAVEGEKAVARRLARG
jgi:magnesium-transporting ATPase (P-type)